MGRQASPQNSPFSLLSFAGVNQDIAWNNIILRILFYFNQTLDFPFFSFNQNIRSNPFLELFLVFLPLRSLLEFHFPQANKPH